MAYQAKKTKKCVEDLELVDENGEVKEIIHVELNPTKMAERLSMKYIDLLNARKRLMAIESAKEPEEIKELYVELGEKVESIFELVFGAEDAKKIYAFYEWDYLEIIKNIVPFITECIIPRVRTIAQESRKEILSSYNRKTRRSMLKKMR